MLCSTHPKHRDVVGYLTKDSTCAGRVHECLEVSIYREPNVQGTEAEEHERVGEEVQVDGPLRVARLAHERADAQGDGDALHAPRDAFHEERDELRSIDSKVRHGLAVRG